MGSAISSKFPRWKLLLKKIALAVTTLVIFGTVWEIILRLNGYGNLEIYDPDPALYWKLKPNQRCYTKVDHKPVRINSLSTRGPEFLPDKPNGTFRILSLGDSRTFGWGLAESETYSSQLQQLLQQKIGAAKKVEVINAGVNAWSFPQMLVYFRDTTLRYQPDAVILAEANLWTQFSEKSSPEFVRKFMWRVRLKNLLRRSAIYHYLLEVKLRAFYERHRTKFIPVDPQNDPLFKEQQQSDPAAVFRSAIENLCSVAQSNGVKPVLLFLPTLNELNASNTASVLKVKQDISRKLSLPLVEFTSDAQAEGKAIYLEADPVHFNPRGNELIDRRLVEAVSALVSNETAGVQKDGQ